MYRYFLLFFILMCGSFVQGKVPFMDAVIDSLSGIIGLSSSNPKIVNTAEIQEHDNGRYWSVGSHELGDNGMIHVEATSYSEDERLRRQMDRHHVLALKLQQEDDDYALALTLQQEEYRRYPSFLHEVPVTIVAETVSPSPLQETVVMAKNDDKFFRACTKKVKDNPDRPTNYVKKTLLMEFPTVFKNKKLFDINSKLNTKDSSHLIVPKSTMEKAVPQLSRVKAAAALIDLKTKKEHKTVYFSDEGRDKAAREKSNRNDSHPASNRFARLQKDRWEEWSREKDHLGNPFRANSKHVPDCNDSGWYRYEWTEEPAQ